jgi:hypothetical protein
MVRYTFEALEAWARDRAQPRPLDETPIEFTDRLALDHAELRDHFRRLAILHARATYARGPLPANALAILEQCWQALEEPALQAA